MRSAPKVLQKFGCPEEKDCPSDSTLPWNQYINIDFKRLDPLAAENKIASYWKINNIDDINKALDDGYAIVIGRTWKSSMNQGGGLSFPWIINRTGYDISGHSTYVAGRNLNYYGKQVSIEPNSYGEDWGDKGMFCCPLS